MVVKLPRAVTSAKVEVFAAAWTRQLAPLARHTADPFTKMALAFNVEPLAALKPNHDVEVPEANERLPADKPVNDALEANKFEEVTLVKVALAPVRF